MIKTCGCGNDFLTEADPYVVLPKPSGMELNCGCYYKGIDTEIELLKEANKVLRGAIGGLIHHCRDYAITEGSFVIAMEVDNALEALAKADEIMGERKPFDYQTGLLLE